MWWLHLAACRWRFSITNHLYTFSHSLQANLYQQPAAPAQRRYSHDNVYVTQPPIRSSRSDARIVAHGVTARCAQRFGRRLQAGFDPAAEGPPGSRGRCEHRILWLDLGQQQRHNQLRPAHPHDPAGWAEPRLDGQRHRAGRADRRPDVSLAHAADLRREVSCRGRGHDRRQADADSQRRRAGILQRDSAYLRERLCGDDRGSDPRLVPDGHAHHPQRGGAVLLARGGHDLRGRPAHAQEPACSRNNREHGPQPRQRGVEVLPLDVLARAALSGIGPAGDMDLQDPVKPAFVLCAGMGSGFPVPRLAPSSRQTPVPLTLRVRGTGPERERTPHCGGARLRTNPD